MEAPLLVIVQSLLGFVRIFLYPLLQGILTLAMNLEAVETLKEYETNQRQQTRVDRGSAERI
jgi:hypothetical protein